MNVVDSSGWIEFFTDGPNAGFFAEPIDDLPTLVVPTLSILEVYRWVLRERGRADALTVSASMRQGQLLDLDSSLAIEAAELSASLRLPMADSVLYASARAAGAELWTQDADFEGLEGVRYRPLSPC